MWHRPLLHVSYLPIQVLKTSLIKGAASQKTYDITFDGNINVSYNLWIDPYLKMKKKIFIKMFVHTEQRYPKLVYRKNKQNQQIERKNPSFQVVINLKLRGKTLLFCYQ